MKPYRITYTDCGEQETWTCKAWSCDHAEEKFWDAMDHCGGPEGIEIASIKKITRKTKHATP